MYLEKPEVVILSSATVSHDYPAAASTLCTALDIESHFVIGGLKTQFLPGTTSSVMHELRPLLAACKVFVILVSSIDELESDRHSYRELIQQLAERNPGAKPIVYIITQGECTSTHTTSSASLHIQSIEALRLALEPQLRGLK